MFLNSFSWQKPDKANHLKGEYTYVKSSFIPLGIPSPSSSLEYLYTTALRMGNKQEELEICLWSQGHDLIVITKIWWDSSHYWNAVKDGSVLFRKDKPVRQGSGIDFYEHIELHLGVNDDWVESLWVIIKGQANMVDTVAGVYYRPPGQKEKADEDFYKQVEVACDPGHWFL